MYIAVAWHRQKTLDNYILFSGIDSIDFETTLTSIINAHFSQKDDIFLLSWTDGFDELVTKILIKWNFKFKLFLSKEDFLSKDKDIKNKLKRIEKNYQKNAISTEVIDGTYIKRNNKLIENADKVLYFEWIKDSFTKRIVENFKENKETINISLRNNIWIVKRKI